VKGFYCLAGLIFASFAQAQPQYWVAIESYRSTERAEAARSMAEPRFAQMLRVERVEVDGLDYYRVLVGPYAERSTADRIRNDADQQGYSGAWVWQETLADFFGSDTPDRVAIRVPAERRIDTLKLVDEAPDGYGLNRLPTEPLSATARTVLKTKVKGVNLATNVDVRLKWFSTANLLPTSDVQRQMQGTPVYDHSVDLRVMLKQDLGPVRLILDHSTIALNGDGVALNLGRDSAVDQTVTNDRNRRWNWTWDIEDGDRHQSLHRLDRLALKYQSGNWGVTVGREAVSWGNGIVFQPMDLFSPFSPTVVDRDYKAGDDLILIDRLLNNGHDLQLLHVARRGVDGDVGNEASSSALKWHGYFGPVEFDVVGAQHYDTDVVAAAFRFPIGQALVRTDIVASEDMYGDQVFSGVINADVSFMLGDKNAYVFGEYFHNGWGVDELPEDITQLPLDLQLRLARGELFNVMKNYLAFGFNYEWHPLISQTATVITNLHDHSSLFQTGFSYSPGDNQTMQLGWVEPLGAPGDEFGGLPLAGRVLTTGGASRVYFRWVYYL